MRDVDGRDEFDGGEEVSAKSEVDDAVCSGVGAVSRLILAVWIMLFPGAIRPPITVPRDLPMMARTFRSLYSRSRRVFSSSVSCSSDPPSALRSIAGSAGPSTLVFSVDTEGRAKGFVTVRRVGADRCEACLVIRHNARYPSKLPFSFSFPCSPAFPCPTSPSATMAFGTPTSANGLRPNPNRSYTFPAAGDGVHRSMTGTRFVGVSVMTGRELSFSESEVLRFRPRLIGDDGD